VSKSDRAWPRAPCAAGLAHALAGIPGIILGAAGYGLATRSGDRMGQVLGVDTVVMCVLSMALRGLDLPALYLEF
jgi:hypothetical protein